MQAHDAIAECEARFDKQNRRFVVITQNIDELHVRAGSKYVLELHGTHSPSNKVLLLVPVIVKLPFCCQVACLKPAVHPVAELRQIRTALFVRHWEERGKFYDYSPL